MQDRTPPTAHLSVRAPRQALSDLGEQPLPAFGWHRYVTRECSEQVDVALGVVVDCPIEVFDGHDVKQARSLDFGSLLRKLTGRGSQRVLGQSLTDGVVDLLKVGEEGISVGREDMLGAPYCQVSTGPQGLCGELIPQVGVHPVPGGCRNHCGILPTLSVPILESGLDHVDWVVGQVRARLGRERNPGLDRSDAELSAGQRQGCFSRSGADLKNAVTRTKPGELDQSVEQFFWILGPSVLIELGGLIERGPQALSVTHAPRLSLQSQ
jgi:hypothetical protein